MAYRIIRSTAHPTKPGEDARDGLEITAILDSASDLDVLGTDFHPGSIAVVADAGTPTYMLNASQVWKEV